jgi:hypothetical protein
MTAVRVLVPNAGWLVQWLSLATFFLLVFLLASVLHGGERPEWLKGYQRTIGGETISYHSPFPDSNSALIVRATDGRMSIEWETEPVPEGFRGSAATFIWMSGLATGKGAHRFDLDVNGVRTLAFTTSEDSSRRTWTVGGAGGASLSFETAMVDQFSELFGFMLLTVPAALLRARRAPRLRHRHAPHRALSRFLAKSGGIDIMDAS